MKRWMLQFLRQSSSLHALLWKSCCGLLLFLVGAGSLFPATGAYAGYTAHENGGPPVQEETLPLPQCIDMIPWDDFVDTYKQQHGASTPVPVPDDRRKPGENILFLKNRCGTQVYYFRLEMIETLACAARKDAPEVAVLLAETSPIALASGEEVQVKYAGRATCQVCCKGRAFPGGAPQIYGKGGLGGAYGHLVVYTVDYHYRPTIVRGLSPKPDTSCGFQFGGEFISITTMEGAILWLNPRFADQG